MALVTTFITSPLTVQFYPAWYQKKVEAYRRGEIDWDGKPLDGTDSIADDARFDKVEASKIRRLTVYLRLDSMPSLLAFTSLFGGQSQNIGKVHPSKQATAEKEAGESSAFETKITRAIQAYGLRLLNLTDRGSSVMQVYESESYTQNDPVVNTFRTFGRLHNLAVSGEALVIPESSFADTIASRARDGDFLLLPWSETGGISEQAVIEDKGTKNKLAAPSYLTFVNETLNQTSVTTGVFINKNFGGPKNKQKKDRLRITRTISSVSLTSHRDAPITAPLTDKSHHIFFPFFGGEDDRAALRLVLQLAENPDITATLVHFEVPDTFLEHSSEESSPISFAEGNKGAQGTVITSTAHRDRDSSLFASLRSSLPAELSNRVLFESVPSDSPVSDLIARASIEVGQSPKNGGDIIILGRNLGRRGFESSIGDDIRSSQSASPTLGVLADKVWGAKLAASVLVVKAAQHRV